MDFTQTVTLSAFGLFIGMIACMEVGRHLASSRRNDEAPEAPNGLGAVDGAVYALLGLLIAFTFSGAAARYEARRLLVGQEANSIGTALLRVDTLPKSAQQELRDLLRRYLDARISHFKHMEQHDKMAAQLKREAALQEEIWSKAVAATKINGAPPSATMLMLPALNDMIDITTTRAVAAQNHPPTIIFVMLALLSLLSALLAGYGMAGCNRSLLHVITFAAITSATFFVILDLEYPRRGLITLDSADKVLLELQRELK